MNRLVVSGGDYTADDVGNVEDAVSLKEIRTTKGSATRWTMTAFVVPVVRNCHCQRQLECQALYQFGANP